jgi:hypothetical protein
MAIPASRISIDNVPSWDEDDECDCPGCGVRLRANITGDDDGDFMEAIVTERDTSVTWTVKT